MTDRLLAGEFLKQWLAMGQELTKLYRELNKSDISQRQLAAEYFQRHGQHDWADVCFGNQRGRKPKGVPTTAGLIKTLKESEDGGLYRLGELVENKNRHYGKWESDKARLVEKRMKREGLTPEKAAYQLELDSVKGGSRVNHSDFLQAYNRKHPKEEK